VDWGNRGQITFFGQHFGVKGGQRGQSGDGFRGCGLPLLLEFKGVKENEVRALNPPVNQRMGPDVRSSMIGGRGSERRGILWLVYVIGS